MSVLRRFADQRPLLFVLAGLSTWVLAGTSIALVISLLFDVPMTDNLPQTLSALGSTGLLLLGAARLDLLRSMGITRLGSWAVWLVTLLLGIYVTLANSISLFGNIRYSLTYVTGSGTTCNLLLRQAVVGFVEETVFRGFVLYAMGPLEVGTDTINHFCRATWPGEMIE